MAGDEGSLIGVYIGISNQVVTVCRGCERQRAIQYIPADAGEAALSGQLAGSRLAYKGEVQHPRGGN